MVFVTDNTNSSKDEFRYLPIYKIMGTQEVSGEIGMEIEVEGNKFPKHEYGDYEEVDGHLIPDEWRYVRDGSLRGVDNAEYVFRQPLKFDEVEGALNNLWDMFDNYGTVLDDSNRTSVHVHLNVQQWHLNRLTSFVALYLCVEELLTQWCGDHRVGNLFCLRAQDAPAIVSQFKSFIKSGGEGGFNNNLHYSGMNFAALGKYGSIEIRSLRGVNNPDTILTWVKILQRIYNLSAEYKDPRSVCEGFSQEGAMALLHKILGEYTNSLISEIEYNNSQIIRAVHSGIRLAQDVCYCADWSKFKELKVTKDPFMRDETVPVPGLQTVAPSLDAFAQSYNDAYYAIYGEYPTNDLGAAGAPTPQHAPIGNGHTWILEPMSTEDAEEDSDDYF